MNAMNPSTEHSLTTGGAKRTLAAVDPDAELHRLIAEYWRLDAEEDRIGEGTGEEPPCLNGHLLGPIEEFEPATMRGVIAKLRFRFDDYELKSLLEDEHQFERIGGRALSSLFRIAAAPGGAPMPAPRGHATMHLHDTSLAMLDALGALNLAIRGLDDESDRRSLAFLAERAGEIATTIDELADTLYHGTGEAAETGPNPDADLHRMISRYRLLFDRHADADADSEEVRNMKALLDDIANRAPSTVRGALAKLRLGFDDDELNSMVESGGLTHVGAAGVRNVLRLLDGGA